MSLRPGIGAGAMALLAQSLQSDAGLDQLNRTLDVPQYLQIGQRKIPLGRYLRKKLREEVGIPEDITADVLQHFIRLKQEELSSVREYSKKNSISFKDAFLKTIEGQILSIEGRDKIHKSTRTKL